METQSETNLWDVLHNELQSELDQYKRELKEIALMLEQSQLEVNKLAQRNASITAHLQQVQTQFESLPGGYSYDLRFGSRCPAAPA